MREALRRHGTAWTATAVLVLATAACSAPIDVRRADAADVYRSVSAFSLSMPALGADATSTLDRAGLRDEFERDPVAALRALHALASTGDRRERLYALSEASYAAAERTHDRSLFVASAVYADLFLFDGGPDPAPSPFSERFRHACDLYDVALSRAFTDDATGEFTPTAGRVALPVGSVDVELPRMPIRIEGFAYDELRPSIEMDVTGFRARNVVAGLGAPLVARRRSGAAKREKRSHLAAGSALAVTALLRVDGGLAELSAGTMHTSLEFLRPAETREVSIAGRSVPVAFDLTAPLAWELSESRPWEHEVSAFFDEEASGVGEGLLLTEPYRRGAVPVLFVHGTASSPARWAEVLNELHADPAIAERCQFWVYQYGSGEPILASAAGLRRRLDRVVRDLDPDGTDAALRDIVVVGHSQGGLLAQAIVSESGDRFWRTVSDRPFDAVEFPDDERAAMRPTFFFEPTPYVRRVVFVATPHGGSHVAGNILGEIVAGLISVPRTVIRSAENLAKTAIGGERLRLENYSNAVDDMTPGSAFLGALAASPMSPRVTSHSIVAIDGTGAVESGGDGVVDYRSAHFPSAASEIVVRSWHSCQGHPEVVAEIRRILREHLAAPR
jgi:triacylglycerol esterase/lipase EstA (alpha/beta hydrolase family)